MLFGFVGVIFARLGVVPMFSGSGGGGGGGSLLLADGVSFLLLADGVSKLTL